MTIADFKSDSLDMIKLTKTTSQIMLMVHEASFICTALMRDRPTGYREDIHIVSDGVEELRREIKRRKVIK